MKRKRWLAAFLLLVLGVFCLPVCADEEVKISKKAAKIMSQALDAINQKQPEQAIELLKKVIGLEPGYAVVYHNLGVLYFEKGMLDEAIASFETAIKLKNDYRNALLALRQALFEAGKTLHGQKDFAKSNSYLQKLAGLPPTAGEDQNLRAATYYFLGFNSFSLQQYSQANEYFDQCQKSEGLAESNLPMYADAIYFMGMMNHILGQYALSSEFFQKYLECHASGQLKAENAAQANYFLGANLFRQLEEKLNKGDTLKLAEFAQQIIPYLNRAVEMNTVVEDAYVMLGNCHVYLKEYDKAIASYQRLCELFPQSQQLKNYQVFLQELQKMQQQAAAAKKKR